jgi:hypothetical protein
MHRRAGAVGIRFALVVAAMFACLAGLAGAGQTAGDDSDLEIREISVRRVAVGEDDPAQGLEDVDAIAGDLLHVRAAVKNSSTTATYEQLRVDFYFTEVVTKEHGLLGTQTVYSLGPGEERLPAISVATAGFTPGFYVFTAAIADPVATQEQSGGTHYIVSYTQPETDAHWRVVADRGPRIAELQDLLEPYPSCQYGGIQKSFSLDARNIGTVPLSIAEVVVEVRPRFGDALGDPLNVTYFPSGLGTPGNFNGKLTVTDIDTGPLEKTVRPLPERLAHFEVLGRGNTTERLQLVVTVTPKAGDSPGPQQTVILPSQEEGAVVFSELDMWQYPQPEACGCESSDGEICYDVPTANPAIRPVGYSSELLFHIAVSEETGEYRIHALAPDDGSSRDWHPLDAVPLTDPVIRYKEGAEPGTFAYHGYVGTSGGSVELYTLLVDKRQRPAVYEWVEGIGNDGGGTWQPEADVVAGATGPVPTTFLQLAEVASGADAAVMQVLVVAGPNGIAVLNADTGKLLQRVTSDRVAYEPAVADGLVWYSTGRFLHGVELDTTGTGSARACSLEFSRDIATPIEHISHSLFWGDGLGNLHALDVSGGCSATVDTDWATVSVPELGPIVGLAMGVDGGIDGDKDPVVFAMDADGVIASIEYKEEKGEFDAGTKRTSQGLRLDGEEDLADSDDRSRIKGTILRPARNGTSAPPVILPEEEPETVLLVAEFVADSGTEGKSGTRWVLVALNAGSDPLAVRRTTNLGDPVQFVLKLDDGVGPMLEPILIGNRLLVVTVPGERLYALDVTDLN